MRYRLFFISVFLAVLSLAAVVGAAKPVEIRFMLPIWNEDVKKWFETEAIPEFQTRNADIAVVIEYTTFAGMNDKVAVSTVAGVAPDVIVTTGEGGAKSQGDSGIIMSLNSYIAKWAEIKDYPPVALEQQKYGNEYFAIPHTMNLRTYSTNIDLMGQAGMDYKAPLGDWPYFLNSVKKLANMFSSKGVSAFRAPAAMYSQVVFAQAGMEWLGSDNRVHMDTPAARSAMQHWNDLYQVSNDVKDPFAGSAQSEFGKGQAVIFWHEVENIKVAADILGGSDSVYLPNPVRDQAILCVTGLAITSSSRNPEAAWKWIAFLSEPKNLIAYNAAFNRIPPRMATVTHRDIVADPLRKLAVNLAIRVKPYSHLSNKYGTYADVRTGIGNSLMAMAKGEKQPDQVAQEIELFWNARIDAVAAK